MQPRRELHPERRIELVEQAPVPEAELRRQPRVEDAPVVGQIRVKRPEQRWKLIVLVPDRIPGGRNRQDQRQQQDGKRRGIPSPREQDGPGRQRSTSGYERRRRAHPTPGRWWS